MVVGGGADRKTEGTALNSTRIEAWHRSGLYAAWAASLARMGKCALVGDRMSKDRTQAIPAFIDLAAQQTHLGDSVETAISAVLKHGLFVLGPEVAELERQLAAFCGAKHCVSCANGTDALTIGADGRGRRQGRCGVRARLHLRRHGRGGRRCAAPRRCSWIFVAIRSTWISRASKPRSARRRSAGLKPRCVIPVDLYGQPADYDAVNEIAKAHGMFVIADAAQSFGASLAGQQGRYACRLYRDQLLSLQAARRLWRRRRRLHR